MEVIADDILIYGAGDTYEEATRQHDAAFLKLLERARAHNLKLNRRKLKFKLSSVTYMGHIVNDQGLCADPDKVKAVVEMAQPEDVQAVQCFIGMINYLSKFLDKLSEVCEPLHRLCDKDRPFDWLAQHDAAFEKIKKAIAEAPVLRFYDVTKPVTVECDASSVGLAAVLTQDGQPVCYASRALSKTEQNYCQLEKECLAICFGLEKFDNYVLGKNVTVLTDHKPLEMIFRKSILMSPKRLQRMRLCLQKYDVTVCYMKGPDMFISDALSRASLPLQNLVCDSDCLIYQLGMEDGITEELKQLDNASGLSVSDERLCRIRQHTANDVLLQQLSNVIQKGWPNDKQGTPEAVRDYWLIETSSHVVMVCCSEAHVSSFQRTCGPK